MANNAMEGNRLLLYIIAYSSTSLVLQKIFVIWINYCRSGKFCCQKM